MRLLTTLCSLCVLGTAIHAADSLTPYSADNVPTNVIDLWKDVDALHLSRRHDEGPRIRVGAWRGAAGGA